MDEELIRRDVAPFADPGTTPEFETIKSKVRLKIIRYGEDRDYLFDLNSGRIDARHSNFRFANIASLLASEEFAALRSFANTQRAVLSGKNLTDLIPASGIINPDGEAADFSLEKGRTLLTPVRQDALRIVLIDGPAGVGKTSFIERMVYERACEASLPPIFHITSKGRRLSNLPDAMGKTASDLNARFRAEHIPILARHNVLQVAIDGFDELVQPDGYGNAWEALKDFVRQMAVNGPLILAGRDTFFDQQGVKRQFDKYKVDLLTIRLNEASETEARDWLVRRGWDAAQFSDPDVIEFFKRDYTRRPFFLSQIAEFDGFSKIPAELGSPQAILVDRLLSREAKLLQPVLQSLSLDDIKMAMSGVFEELAVDMAERETESASLGFVEFLCEYAFSEIATPDERNALTKKIGSAPFLEKGVSGTECKFPHSEIQNHFLALALISALSAGDPFPSLRSALYGADAIEAFADVFRSLAIDKATAVTSELLRLLREERHTFRLTANVGALLIGSLVRKSGNSEPIEVADLVSGDVRVFDELADARLSNVTIPNFDVRATDLSKVTFDRCNVSVLIVDETTRFGNSQPVVSAIQLHSKGRIHVEHDAAAIRKWMQAHSSTPDAPEGEVGKAYPLARLMEKICRRFMRQHYIRENERDDAGILLKDPLWPELAKILSEEGVLTSTLRNGTSGPPDKFYFLHSPEKLLTPGGDVKAAHIRHRVFARAVELSSS